jgi:xanthine dehydrogenase YagR molybdenum-binding subunit
MNGDDDRSGITRRSFLTGTGVGVAAAGLGRSAETFAAEGHGAVLGPAAVPITLTVNGRPTRVEVEPRTTLADALRFAIGLTGTKVGCDRGACGACTVHLDGKAVCACLTLAIDAEAHAITTVEGLAKGGTLSRLQSEFIAHDAMQCGFCTPGMIMSCAALLAADAHPSLDAVKTAVSGNLCRCGTYPKVFAATLAAAGQQLPAGTHVVAHAAELHDQPRDLARPAGEPPPWPRSQELHVVGKPTARVDGKLKVTGAARYTADVRLPGMLFARRVVSPHPHARVKAIDTSAAEKLPGVRAVHVVERNREGATLRNPPKAADKYPLVRYAGQTVAAVAATTQAIADEAARLVKVTWEPLPFVVDVDEARKPGAPRVYPGPVEQPPTPAGGGAPTGLAQDGNSRGPNKSGRGDIEAGFREAEVGVEGEFRTHVQTHSAMETHGVVADWRPDGLTLYASTQGTASVREEAAEVFGLPQAKVHVITEFMGGGFGAKFGLGSYGVIATHLSKQAGAPVRLMLDRKEEHTSVGNRPSSHQRLKLGARRDGSLTALSLASWGTGGISTGAGVGRMAEQLYRCANVRIEQYDVFTHAGPAAAFRAPGQPQGAFALEQLIDELADKLAIDPLALRDKLDVSDRNEPARAARRSERKLGAERFGWARRRPAGSDSGVVKRGMGVAQSMWGRYLDLDSAVELRLHRDGSIELLSGVQDIGTGTRTALAMVVAEELGVRADEVNVNIGNTDHPVGAGSGGSVTTLSMTPPARTAAWQLKQKLAQLVPRADKLPLKKAAAKLPNDYIAVQATRVQEYGGDPHGSYGGVQFCEVAVDTETGVVKVERMVAVHDCGRVINPLAVQSQINGGIIQGLSWALYEQRHLDRATGRMVNPNLDQYKIAGAKEVPQIEVVLIDQYLGRNATDAGGVGEPANIATAAAIANAVYNAVGVRLRELPMRPATVLAALATGKETRR